MKAMQVRTRKCGHVPPVKRGCLSCENHLYYRKWRLANPDYGRRWYKRKKRRAALAAKQATTSA